MVKTDKISKEIIEYLVQSGFKYVESDGLPNQISKWFRDNHKFMIYPHIDTEFNYNENNGSHKDIIKWSCETRVDYVLQWNSMYNEFDSYDEAIAWGIGVAAASIGLKINDEDYW